MKAENGTEYIRWETVDRCVSEMMFSQQVGNNRKDYEKIYEFMQNYQRPEFIPEPTFSKMSWFRPEIAGKRALID